MNEHEKLIIPPRELLPSIVNLELNTLQQVLAVHNQQSENYPLATKVDEFLTNTTCKNTGFTYVENRGLHVNFSGNDEFFKSTYLGVLVLSPGVKHITITRCGELPLEEPCYIEMTLLCDANRITTLNMIFEADNDNYAFCKLLNLVPTNEP